MVIYDPARRYHNLALALDTPQCRVIDAGPSTIEAREAAMRALRDLTEGKIHQIIVWLPTRKPESDEDRQGDPFSVLGRIGAEFPDGDADDYPALCRAAKPDHVVEINKLFEEGEPSFDTVDALSLPRRPLFSTFVRSCASTRTIKKPISPKPSRLRTS